MKPAGDANREANEPYAKKNGWKWGLASGTFANRGGAGCEKGRLISSIANDRPRCSRRGPPSNLTH
jgi:hypothetical protein